MKGYGIVKTHEAGWLDNPKPVAGPLDAILRPIYIAPCSSDVHGLHGGSGPRDGKIMGHESIGEVVEVGSCVQNFKPGDKVVVPCVTPDWAGSSNLQGKRKNAHDHKMKGSFKLFAQKDGVFAEFYHVNCADTNLVHLPDNVDPYAALMTVDMMSTGFYAAELADIEFGDSVVVFGIGPVGLMAIRAAVLKGAGRVIGIGTRPRCVEIAKQYGATDIVSYKDGDIVESVLGILNGTGADRVIIAGGGAESLGQAIGCVRPGGTVSTVNYFDINDTLTIPALAWGLGMSDIDIKCGFCQGGALRIEKMLSLIMNGRVNPELLVTHKYEGFESIKEAFEIMEKKPAELIKPAVKIEW